MQLTPEISHEYPFTQNFFTQKDGFKINYIDEGNKTSLPTIFLHGNPTWSFFYRKLILSLSEEFRCIAPDHLGCGLSDKPDLSNFTYDLRGHSENLVDLLKDLQIEKFNLVVHDWGGAIGLSAFRNNFKKINKLVLLNTAAFSSKDVPKRIRFCRLPMIGEFFVRYLNGFAGPATWMATNKKLSKTIKSGFLFPYQNWRDRIAVWRFVKDIPLENNHPSLSYLLKTDQCISKLNHIPTMACWGMKDFCFHGGFLREWKKRLPNLTVHEINNAGHYLLEDEFEYCERTITSFLTT